MASRFIRHERTLWVSSFSFQLLAEINAPAEADDSKIIIMVNSFVAFGCTNIHMDVALACIKLRFHVIKRDRSYT